MLVQRVAGRSSGFVTALGIGSYNYILFGMSIKSVVSGFLSSPWPRITRQIGSSDRKVLEGIQIVFSEF